MVTGRSTDAILIPSHIPIDFVELIVDRDCRSLIVDVDLHDFGDRCVVDVDWSSELSTGYRISSVDRSTSSSDWSSAS